MLIMGYFVSQPISVKDAISKVGGAKNVPINKRILQKESERLQNLKRRREDEEQELAQADLLEMEKQ